MEFKGTKGKWFVEYNGYYNEVLSTINDYNKGFVFRASTILHDCSKGLPITDMNNSNEDKANAQLIAHAPEMLEMLNKVLEVNKHHGFNGHLINEQIKDLLTRATTI